MRKATIKRMTKEVEINCNVDLDGTGVVNIETKYQFFSHMLTSFAKHAMIDIQLSAKGDLPHHVLEDSGLALGKAIKEALGKKQGINRFGFAQVPMDDSLASVTIDLSNRYYAVIDIPFTREEIADTATEDLIHFLESFAQSLQANLHAQVFYGSNNHHMIEAVFKALAVSIKRAVSIDPRKKNTIPSVKGEI
jgi:imidazoleglycerol-phosphate dehydratase